MPALTAVLGGIPSWLWRVLAYLAIAATLFGFGYLKGDEHGTEKLTAYVGKQSQESAALVTKHQQVAGPVVTQYIHDTKVIHDQVQTIQDAITKDVPRGTMLSFSWRLLHDAAATGTVPDTAVRTDGPAIDAQDAADTITSNYTSARLNAAQLGALEVWVCKNWKIDHSRETPDFNCPTESP